MVQFDKVWEINTKKDLENAIASLEDAQFYANMSDDFSAWNRETDEIERQKRQVIKQAKAKGLL